MVQGKEAIGNKRQPGSVYILLLLNTGFGTSVTHVVFLTVCVRKRLEPMPGIH